MPNPTIDSTISLTFSECAENDVRAPQYGRKAARGLDADALRRYAATHERCEILEAGPALESEFGAEVARANDACVLILRKGVDTLSGEGGADAILEEQIRAVEYSSAGFMYGRVVTKRARTNTVFVDAAASAAPSRPGASADIVDSVYLFEDLPALARLRAAIDALAREVGVPDAVPALFAEGNLYTGSGTGIGFHGDTERRIVICARIGKTALPIAFVWHRHATPVGPHFAMSAVLRPGDVYLMSEKATGSDWKNRPAFHLRHAAGSPKYLVPTAYKAKTCDAVRKKAAIAAANELWNRAQLATAPEFREAVRVKRVPKAKAKAAVVADAAADAAAAEAGAVVVVRRARRTPVPGA